MNRDAMWDAVDGRDGPWDLIVIGGGATGLGTALDAAARGYAVVLFEQSDFAKGTSSRSTKLVHGGVRYLQRGDVSLVAEALTERGLLRRNAPHLVHDRAFIVPSYEWWESPFYGIGLKVYDLLAGRYGFGRSAHLSPRQVQAEIPSIRTDGLRGGTRYFDGQFDDARLAVHLAATACQQGAVLLNYAPVTGFVKKADGTIAGVRCLDAETGSQRQVAARAVINAAGPFVDTVRRLDRPQATPVVAPSQGVHLVLERSFIPGQTAIMVPHTDDGRVLFAIPWYDVAVVGTTDTPIEQPTLEPHPTDAEIDFLLQTANRYLDRPATRADVRSVFAGIRPLAHAGDGPTAALSRRHAVLVDPVSGLITAAGGKWTTYRRMADDIVQQAAAVAGLTPTPCRTRDLPIHGYCQNAQDFGALAFYGSDAGGVQRLARTQATLAGPLHPRLAINGAQVAWACRHEMARTVEDVLARRTRALLFDAAAAIEAAPAVAAIMAAELGRDSAWAAGQAADFGRLAAAYRPSDAPAAHRPPS